MKRQLLMISTCAVALLLMALAVLAIVKGFQPPETLETTGTMTLVHQEDGQNILSWPEMPDADQYQVTVLKNNKALFEKTVENELECTLPDLPFADMLTVRIAPISNAIPRKEITPLEVTAVIAPPAVEKPVRTIDAQTNTVSLQFTQAPNSTLQLYICKTPEERELLMTTEDGMFSVSFGENGDFAIPAHGQDLIFTYTCSKSLEGLDLHWYTSDRISVSREDFLNRNPGLTLVDEGHNRFTLRWNETKGDHQLLQLWNEDTKTWDTVRKYGHQDTLTYDTGYLPKYNHYIYRVIGVGGQVLPDSDFSTQPETVEMTTGASALFATVWPIQTLDVYSNADRGTVIGSVPEGKAFTVIEVCNGMFRIRYEGEQQGYVDSNYCMVNLPDYMGERCAYQITNSFDSLYMIHNYEIPDVTDSVVTGYEHVLQENGEYLVPLLYPTAQKLDQATTVALELGYQLIIYDAYRPHATTRELYDVVSEMLNDKLPSQNYYGEDTANPSQTYAMLMTDNGRYNLSYFLAKVGSKHNLGVALDLTLIDLSTGEELMAQTTMHDLSWYSEIGRNNDVAKLLSDIMTQAGFSTLVSEWWHFQDMDAINDLNLTNFMRIGISAECWVIDELGWRYRRADGSMLTNCTQTIEEITYHFDAQGYASVAGN